MGPVLFLFFNNVDCVQWFFTQFFGLLNAAIKLFQTKFSNEVFCDRIGFVVRVELKTLT